MAEAVLLPALRRAERAGDYHAGAISVGDSLMRNYSRGRTRVLRFHDHTDR